VQESSTLPEMLSSYQISGKLLKLWRRWWLSLNFQNLL